MFFFVDLHTATASGRQQSSLRQLRPHHSIMSESKPYIVSARKYRPATFKTVVGQKSLTGTLKNAIDSKRLAQAYLFCGPRGVGKTSCARIFAKTINCLNPTPEGEACGVCESCRAIEDGSSFNIIELDAASNNSVDDIRALTEQVKIAPQVGSYRVFIIDEVHMLSSAAFNAFLKTLEEPPKYVVFILATTEKHKVIPTILSRCQIYDFKRITVDDMIDHLQYVAEQEGIEADRKALGVVALKADGAMRDALSIFDQVAASTMGHVTYEATIANLNVLDYDYYFRLVDACRDGDVPTALLIYKEIRDKGFDSLFFVNGLAAHIRDLMVAADSRTADLLETSADVAQKYAVQARSLPLQWYYAAIKILNDCDFQYRTASGKRLLVELALIRLCQLLKPVQPPFDQVDRIPPLRDPAESLRGNDSRPAENPQPAQPDPIATPAAPAASTTKPATPVAQVATTLPATAGNRVTVKPKVSTFRISDAVRQTRETVEPKRLNTPFTPEMLTHVWNDFIDANPGLHILVSAMRNSMPQPCGQFSYKMTVDHPAQLQAFESSMKDLLEFIRTRLSNDSFTLNIELNSRPEEELHVSPREFLRTTAERNAPLAAFLKHIDAELD